MKNQKSRWPRGKMLGGSSNLNYLFYVRGDPRDFNYWHEDLGLEGLSSFDNGFFICTVRSRTNRLLVSI